MWTHINHPEPVFAYVCIPRWPCVSVFAVPVSVCILFMQLPNTRVHPKMPLSEHIAGYALSSSEYTTAVYFPDFECMFVFVCERVCTQ